MLDLPVLPFLPWSGARGPLRQTLLGASPLARPRVRRPWSAFEAVTIPLRDGGALEGRYQSGAGTASVLLLHGLGGSLESGYLVRAAVEAQAQGLGVLALAHRGSGEARERTQRPYMAGNTADLADALRWLRSRPSSGRVLAVGFSISGNTLLKWLGQGEGDLPDEAIAVAPPINLEAAARGLVRWPARGLELHVLGACRRWIPRLQGEDPPAAPYRVGRLASFLDFDRDYITPVWGFTSRDEYYASASACSWTSGVRTPTLVLAADDDPMSPVGELTAARWGPGARLVVTRGGGHLGWLAAGQPGRPRRWLDETLRAAFLHAACSPQRPAFPGSRAEEALVHCSAP